ncbi:myb/SANT-like DNA-binding domain-containing protein 3 [Eriocheir sinensis]|uniref:myb/SANT-like DNA-binding domain-containing protein 3 n=1 Tax=Eriocheir sinensis TaxID=95602 RepID=UPI0021C6F898|nr:myb/SANT-like DNA-binding domain-containing protein 3 [Eriocheir sinensis]
MATPGKGAPLSQGQKKFLLELVSEKPVLQDKSHGMAVTLEKVKAWQEIAAAFSLNYPADPKSEKQLKRAWEYTKMRAKKNHSHRVQHMFATGGGKSMPSPPKEDQLIMSTLSRELEPATQQCDTLDPNIVVVDASEVEQWQPEVPSFVKTILRIVEYAHQQDASEHDFFL